MTLKKKSTESGQPQSLSSQRGARAVAPRRVNKVYTAAETVLLQLGGRVGGCIKVGWMEWIGGGTQSSCHFQTSLNQQKFPLFRVDRRTRGLLCLFAQARGNGGRKVLKGGCRRGINEGIESNSLILGSTYRCTWGSSGARGWGMEFDAMQTGSTTQAAAPPQTHHKSILTRTKPHRIILSKLCITPPMGQFHP